MFYRFQQGRIQGGRLGARPPLDFQKISKKFSRFARKRIRAPCGVNIDFISRPPPEQNLEYAPGFQVYKYTEKR